MISALAQFCIKQAVNLKKAVTGRPLTTPSLGSMTLDRDDVKLAKEWLRNKEQWHNTEIIKKYESEFARWNGSKYAFAAMGGRVALSACIYALDLKPGDEVILPGYTCIVVPNAFHYEGVKTVYADIELDTYGLDVHQIERKITARTKAIVLHHLYGLVCREYEAILALAKQRGLYVIEDCAHATGAVYKGKKVGNYGDVAFYSSEQSKIFNTIQGGIVVTNNDALGEKLRRYFDKAPYPDAELVEKQLFNVILNFYQYKHPQRWWRADIVKAVYGNKILVSTSDEEMKGIRPAHYGRKMPAPIAALGMNQLRKIDRYNDLRRQSAGRWDAWCEKHGYKKPMVIEDSIPVFLRYPVIVEPGKKSDTVWALTEMNIDLGVWFVSNVHPAPISVPDCPNADIAVRQCINFPCLM